MGCSVLCHYRQEVHSFEGSVHEVCCEHKSRLNIKNFIKHADSHGQGRKGEGREGKEKRNIKVDAESQVKYSVSNFFALCRGINHSYSLQGP